MVSMSSGKVLKTATPPSAAVETQASCFPPSLQPPFCQKAGVLSAHLNMSTAPTVTHVFHLLSFHTASSFAERSHCRDALRLRLQARQFQPSILQIELNTTLPRLDARSVRARMAPAQTLSAPADFSPPCCGRPVIVLTPHREQTFDMLSD